MKTRIYAAPAVKGLKNNVVETKLGQAIFNFRSLSDAETHYSERWIRYPANTRRWPDVGLMLPRRWATISPKLGHRLVFAGEIFTQSVGLHSGGCVDCVTKKTIAHHFVAHDARHNWT